MSDSDGLPAKVIDSAGRKWGQTKDGHDAILLDGTWFTPTDVDGTMRLVPVPEMDLVREGRVPCPFCGGSLLEMVQNYGRNTKYMVICRGCQADGPRADTVRIAHDLWNSRASADKARELTDAVMDGTVRRREEP